VIKLKLISPGFAGQGCDLPDGNFIVGRDHKNHIVILDASVSARHCELLVHGPDIIVRECGSLNGTYVNGVRIDAQHGVHHGERLRCGNVEIQVQIDRPVLDDDTDPTAFHAYSRAAHAPAVAPAPTGQFSALFRPVNSDAPTEQTSFVRQPDVPNTPSAGGSATAGGLKHDKAYRWWAIAAAATVLLALLGFALL
jgi:predicted component of type VI protein secretion system